MFETQYPAVLPLTGHCCSLPIIGDFLRKLSAARIARTLGLLLENGVSLLSALEIVKNIAGNVLIADAVEVGRQPGSAGPGTSRITGCRPISFRRFLFR